MSAILMALLILLLGMNRQASDMARQHRLDDVDKSSREPWPRFTMVYRVMNRISGRVTVDSWTVHRLTYISKRVFCVEIIQSPLKPTPSPKERLKPGPAVPPPPTCEEMAERAKNIPEDEPINAISMWLVPSELPPIAMKSGAHFNIGDDGLATAYIEGLFPDQSGGMFASREETTFRLQDGIPVRYAAYRDGNEVARAEVLELTIHGPSIR